MDGRTWSVVAPRTVSPGNMEMTLTGTPGVVDALVQGEQVRIVTTASGFPEALAYVPDMTGNTIVPVAPRFEGCFCRYAAKPEGKRYIRATINRSRRREQLGVRRGIGGHQGERTGAEFRRVPGRRQVRFDVRRGEIFGLLGANGAGKSTTFRMLYGLLPASSGHLEVAGLDLRHAAATTRERIDYMSQKFSQYTNLSVGQNLVFFAPAPTRRLAGAHRGQQEWAEEEEFDLGRYHRGQLAGDLPLGYKQRLAMACALMHGPEILFSTSDVGGRSLGQARVLATHQRPRAGRRHRHGNDAFHGETEYCDHW